MNRPGLLRRAPDGTLAVSRGQLFVATIALLVCALLAALTAPPAHAISDSEELSQFGSLGSGAGQLGQYPAGSSPTPRLGPLCADPTNNRIAEFTPWGDFVKAFGSDVDRSGQRAAGSQGQGSVRTVPADLRRLHYPDLSFDAAALKAKVREASKLALDALPSIGGQAPMSASVQFPALPTAVPPMSTSSPSRVPWPPPMGPSDDRQRH